MTGKFSVTGVAKLCESSIWVSPVDEYAVTKAGLVADPLLSILEALGGELEIGPSSMMLASKMVRDVARARPFCDSGSASIVSEA